MIEGSGTGDDARPAWPGSGQPFVGETAPSGSWYAWRLSGGNHRELGRSAAVHPDRQSVVQAVERLRGSVDRAMVTYVISPTGGQWTWRMTVDGEPVATSSRAYFRQRECAYSSQVFLSAVGEAPVPTSSVRRHRHAQVNNWRTPDDDVRYGPRPPLPSPVRPPSVDLGRPPS